MREYGLKKGDVLYNDLITAHIYPSRPPALSQETLLPHVYPGPRHQGILCNRWKEPAAIAVLFCVPPFLFPSLW